MLFTSILTSFVLALPLIQARSTPVARSTHIARAGSDVQIDFIKVVDAVSFVLGQVNTTAALEDLAAGNPQTAIVALETFGFLTRKSLLPCSRGNVLLIFSCSRDSVLGRIHRR
jgi:hypothetical protein